MYGQFNVSNDGIARPQGLKVSRSGHQLHGDPHSKDLGIKVDENTMGQMAMAGAARQQDMKDFDRINNRMGWELLKVKLANKANLSMARAAQHFKKELPGAQAQLLQFALAKYQGIKMLMLKKDFFSGRNFLNEDAQLWARYKKSSQYRDLVNEVEM